MVFTNQRGIALLSVLGLLSVLLVLASIVAGSSRMEAALSGLSKESARAFAAAEAGLNYGLQDVDNFVSTDSLSNTCVVSATCATAPVDDLPACYRETNLVAAGLFTTANKATGFVRACFDHEGPPPTSIKVSALRFKAFHFDLDSRGNAVPTGTSKLQMEAARLGPAQ
jgi:Tfp pilus assembly protein PilX